ncbi:MAG: PD-(D/E)XK nuclease family protein [Prevotellaceae bacterium]|jgi:CRISPR/Cas system-associated exonuclease Cas4 (RecB family)|nr:PD-(D/E)XK nuclease family protein [Prevotellaceae bacterium]
MNKNAFLYAVAEDLYAKFGSNMSDVVIVTPSRRTRLFMEKYLPAVSNGKPVWTPQYTNIIGLCSRASDLTLPDDTAEHIEMVYLLYNVYKEVCKAEETFDEFYFFGETLLNDFNDIDLYLVSADQLLGNLHDLEDFKDFSYLTDEQKEVIKRFFNHDTDLKNHFFSVWDNLKTVYYEFKKRLFAQGKAYEGMLIRNLVEGCPSVKTDGNSHTSPFKGTSGSVLPSVLTDGQVKYVFVGYSHLTTAEFTLLRQLKNESFFYWDSDKYYLEQEAGKFLKRYISFFGNELKLDNDNFLKPKKIQFVESSNALAQTGYISKWLETLKNPDFDDAATAIVLCDEKLLPATLSALPLSPDNAKPNIAILYNLMQSSAASLLLLLLDLQTKGLRRNAFNITYLQPVLRHAYIQNIYPKAQTDEKKILKSKRFYITPDCHCGLNPQSPKILTNKTLFDTKEKNAQELLMYLQNVISEAGKTIGDDVLETEAIFKIYQLLNHLRNIADKLEKPTLIRLLKRLLSAGRVPYYGEPARGIQIMAMSDTRNMDFRNVLLLSVNEGIMPKIEPETSFIPPFIRRHFEMNTIEEQDSQTAYNFFRLLGRAENIALCYNTGKQSTGKGEMSRYMLQMLTETPFKIERITLKTDIQNTNKTPAINIQKTPEIFKKLNEKYNSQLLSPSAFNAYIDCPLQFYFKVANIKKPNELSDELDNALLGSIFHRSMELIYNDCKEITADFFDTCLKNGQLTPASLDIIQKAFVEEYFQTDTRLEDYNGVQHIYFKVLARMLKNTLLLDKKNTPFEILELEKSHGYSIFINDNASIKVGGIIDRIDRSNGIVRVVDYKTGSAPQTGDYSKNIADIVEQNRKSKDKYRFQTFLYAYVLQQEGFCAELPTPALLFPLAADDEAYSPELKFDDNDLSDFANAFIAKLQELFDKNTPFSQCKKADACKYCDYKSICGR